MWSYNIILGVTFSIFFTHVSGIIGSDEDADDSGNTDLGSSELVGASVTQIFQHPYSASLMKNDTYLCSAIVLNTYWLLTSSKCFESDVISSYVTHRNLANFTVRTGSSYNNKSGSLSKIKMLINNFDMKVSAVKLVEPLTFGPGVGAIRLPRANEEISLGYLASIIAWTPSGHIRLVNVPLIDSTLCEPYTKMLPGHYICSGGVQDPNRHFCRKDNGGAVIQNNTLVGIATFLHTCAIYTKIHAFPKVSSFSRWLDTVIWDEETRPTAPTDTTSKAITNATEKIASYTNFVDPRKFLLTLPFDPVNVPLEPAEDNSVIPRMSLYESYLQNMARARTSTTTDPRQSELKRFEGAQRMPQQMFARKYDAYEYN